MGQSLDSDLAVLRVAGALAAVLLRGGDENVARAELRPALRGKLAWACDRFRHPPPAGLDERSGDRGWLRDALLLAVACHCR
jgi:hypothetical protein